MKALITSAGKGSRLGSLTRNTNKCLLNVRGKSLLTRSVEDLKKNGINDVIVVTGYQHEKVQAALRGKASFIFNPFYEVSGILASIWLAKEYFINESMLFVTGDSIYHPDILKQCLSKKGDIIICVQIKKCDQEASKIQIRNKKVVAISKDVALDKAAGEFLGMVKMNNRTVKKFFRELDLTMKKGYINSYLADILMALNRKGTPITLSDVKNNPYIEIDTKDDLKTARKIFLC